MHLHSCRKPSPTDPASAALNFHSSSSTAHDLHVCSPIAPERTFLQQHIPRIYSPTTLQSQNYIPAAPKFRAYGHTSKQSQSCCPPDPESIALWIYSSRAYISASVNSYFAVHTVVPAEVGSKSFNLVAWSEEGREDGGVRSSEFVTLFSVVD